jgi:hypothetical protein
LVIDEEYPSQYIQHTQSAEIIPDEVEYIIATRLPKRVPTSARGVEEDQKGISGKVFKCI